MAATKLVPLSPEWWTDRLYKQLVDRQPAIRILHNYYGGDHPLPWLPKQIREVAQRILKMTRTNYMGLVVDAMTERQEILGFRLVDDDEDQPDENLPVPDLVTGNRTPTADDKKAADQDEVDKAMASIWQYNHMDSQTPQAFREAGISGCTYWLVSPNPDPKKKDKPLITLEHPAQMIVEYSPHDKTQRDAALKVWFDDRVGLVKATLYLPDKIYKWQGKKNTKPNKWVQRTDSDDEEWGFDNPFDEVPVFEWMNNAQTRYVDDCLEYRGVSEIEDVLDVQDRVNKTIADRLVTQDFGAFPQKWATGWGSGDDDDEQAAAAEQQSYAPNGGASHPASQVDLGRDRIIVSTDEKTRFGEWASAPMDPYSNAKNEDVKDIAARTRTPAQYLLGNMENVSGDALQSAESGLVSKIRERERGLETGIEQLVEFVLKVSGDKRDFDRITIETVWRSPEFRTLGQVTDAAIKKHIAGLTSWQQTMEDMDYSPAQIRRNRIQKRRDAMADKAMNFTGLGPAAAGGAPANAAVPPGAEKGAGNAPTSLPTRPTDSIGVKTSGGNPQGTQRNGQNRQPARDGTSSAGSGSQARKAS